MAENTKTDYGKFDKFIHWLMALNIILTLIFARGMSELPFPERLHEYGDHGLSVTTIMICLIIRAGWRIKEGFAVLPPSMTDLQVKAAKAVHYGLYGALFAQVAVGVFLASTTEKAFVAKGYNIDYSSFNLAPDSMYETLLSFHQTIYWSIIALLVLHIGAALKHHFVDRDNVLRRMLPFVKPRIEKD
ncbi:MAG: cytochrome b [Halieaceae bacterium]|jgi:cytochrome b561|nr:cytochrome b [Halieaceae bacterium]